MGLFFCAHAVKVWAHVGPLRLLVDVAQFLLLPPVSYTAAVWAQQWTRAAQRTRTGQLLLRSAQRLG